MRCNIIREPEGGGARWEKLLEGEFSGQGSVSFTSPSVDETVLRKCLIVEHRAHLTKCLLSPGSSSSAPTCYLDDPMYDYVPGSRTSTSDVAPATLSNKYMQTWGGRFFCSDPSYQNGTDVACIKIGVQRWGDISEVEGVYEIWGLIVE